MIRPVDSAQQQKQDVNHNNIEYNAFVISYLLFYLFYEEISRQQYYRVEKCLSGNNTTDNWEQQ